MAIWTTNIRGIVQNFDDLLINFSLRKPLIAAINETHLTADISDSALCIDSYYFFRRDRGSNSPSWGGTIVYFRSDLNLTRLHAFESPDFETIWFILKLPDLEIIGTSVYHPPGSNLRISDHFSACIDRMNFGFNTILIILGDLNAHFANWDFCRYSNTEGIALNSFLNDYDLTQIVTQPTRKHNCLDFVITNCTATVSFETVMPPIGSSDHGIVSITLSQILPPLRPPSQTSTYPSRYSFYCGNADWGQLNTAFSDVDWSFISEHGCIDSAWLRFKSKYREIIAACLPALKINHRVNPNPCSVTLTPTLLALRRSMRDLWEIHKQTRTELSHQRFSTARREYRNAISAAKAAKAASDVDKILSSSNPKLWHRYTRSLYKPTDSKASIPPLRPAGCPIPISDARQKAQCMNNSFTKKFHSDSSKAYPDFPSQTNKSLSSVYIDEVSVLAELSCLDVSTATGPCGIQSETLRECRRSLAQPLTLLFQKSLDMCCLPLEWKTAIVNPIFKNKGLRTDPDQYRPISLTSIVGKLLEKLVNTKLLRFLLDNNLISKSQFGFLPKHSTADQLALIHHKFLSFLEEKKSVLACFLDLSAAFDTVPHAAIRHKLRAYGIHGKLHAWISNFLSGRTQCVRIDGQLSDVTNVTSGVPQGSVIAPTLFVLFINDLSDSLSSFHDVPLGDTDGNNLLYADDTMLYTAGCNAELLTLQMNIDLISASAWADRWVMKFDPLKTVALFISTDGYLPSFPVRFSDTEIPFSPSHTHLGLKISNTLSLDPLVDDVSRKAASQIFLLKRLASVVQNQELLLRVYNCYIRPHFEYASPSWSALNLTQTERLERLQRRAMRIILGYDYTTPLTQHDYAALRLSPLQARRNFATACWAYKLFQGNLPRAVSEFKYNLADHGVNVRFRRLIMC
ncbi:MAG: reverse transcriptase domain-containing protein, partial [Pirellulales bacterium]